VESNAIPLKDENGDLKYILIIYEDKTEVEKESMILKNFIELNPYAIEIKDKNGYNIMYNQAFIDLWEGTPPDDYSVLEDPKMKETGQIEFFKRLYNGNIIDVQEFYFNPHESRSDLPDHPAWLRTVCFPIFNRKREVDQVVIMYEDITERKLAQIKLEQLKKQLENRVKERTILLENSEKKYRKAYKRTKCFKGLFTHDVSNIVQVVSNSLELLKERMGASLEKRGKEKGLISAMETNLARAKKMIHNIRNLEEIEESEVPIIPTKLFFHLENAIGFVKANFINKNIQISLQKDLEEIYVLANELLLDVFENIFINAIRYNDNDIITIDIKVSEFSEEEKDFIKIEFIDNGIGIKDSRKERIFEENYERGNSSKGMGLGLSLVSKIITLCHGNLWVENRIPDDHSKGSNFIVQIPKAITK
jgi:signal transduction histidine kinase